MTKTAAVRSGVALVVCILLSGGCSDDHAAIEWQNKCGIPKEALGRFIDVPSGQFKKGRAPVYPEEGPTITLHVMEFSMLAHEVTNAEFSTFVDATGYVTDAERSARLGGVGAGSAVFKIPSDDTASANPWQLVAGATWRSPGGTDSDIDGLELHPVVHVSLNDAREYAEWAGGRLPSETEWEYAASLGLVDRADPVSGAFDRSGEPLANTWQGFFPFDDSSVDGFSGTAPVGCFAQSELGLYDMIGNVWEWTDTPFDTSSETRTIKGGSFLCADNYCRRYRPAARQPQERNFSASHIGFRIIKDGR